MDSRKDAMISLLRFALLLAWMWMSDAQRCGPIQPILNYSAVVNHPRGIQAIVPTYTFNCRGYVTLVGVHADPGSGLAGFWFQIWRPLPNCDSVYRLRQSVSLPATAARKERVVSFPTRLAVRAGDVVGYQLERNDSREYIKIYVDHLATMGHAWYWETEEAVCEVSLHVEEGEESNIQSIRGAPFIFFEFEAAEEVNTTTPPPQCKEEATATTCKVITPSPSSTSSSSSSSSFTTATTSSPSINANKGEIRGDSALFELTAETVVVLVIGLLLFIVLIVLIVVLILCLCRKKPPEYRFKSPLPGDNNIGTPITNSVASVHSMAPLTNGSGQSSAHYINSVVIENRLNSSGASTHFKHQQLSQSTHCPAIASRKHPSPALPPRMYGHRSPLSRSTTHLLSPPPPPLLKATPSLPSLTPSGHAPSSPLLTEVPERGVCPSVTPDLSLMNLAHTRSYDHLLEEREEGGREGMVSSTPLSPQRDYDHLTTEERGSTKQQTSSSNVTVEKRKLTAQRSQNVYTYVPTEDQRRILKFHSSGHYEMEATARGYDHLKFFQEREVYWAPATTTSGLYTQLYENKYRELPRDLIIIQCQIGAGHFGSVSKGVWLLRDEEGEVVEGENVEVAVKVVKREAEEVQRVKLLQEAAIMGQFAHPNVVRLHGVVTVGDPIMIVLEYMPRGDLHSYLLKFHPSITKREVGESIPSQFIKFGKDIAAGMSYLARKNFVHRDLAARNILLNCDLTCKIGDFGMARDIAGGESDYYKSHGGIIPVKWTAPESLNYNKYTSASDVWSYGMVLYEVWSLGHKPFHDLTNPIVIALVTSKHCQAPPPGCSRPIYHLMVECWNPKDTQRPTFDSILDYLDSPEEGLLQWLPADLLPGKQAHVLGASLVEANNLYLDLQRLYQNQMLAQLKSNRT